MPDSHGRQQESGGLIEYPDGSTAIVDGQIIKHEHIRPGWRIYAPIALVALSLVFSAYNSYTFWRSQTPNDWLGQVFAVIPAGVIAAAAGLFVALMASAKNRFDFLLWLTAAVLMAAGSFAANLSAMYLHFRSDDLAKLRDLAGPGVNVLPLIAAIAVALIEVFGGIMIGLEIRAVEDANASLRNDWQGRVDKAVQRARARVTRRLNRDRAASDEMVAAKQPLAANSRPASTMPLPEPVSGQPSMAMDARLDDLRKTFGTRPFTRKQVESTTKLSRSACGNLLRYGRGRGRLTELYGNRWQFVKG